MVSIGIQSWEHAENLLSSEQTRLHCPVFLINVETVSRLSLLLEAIVDWLSPVT